MIEILSCEQGTPEWLAARCGWPTASKFSAILAKGEGKTRRSYLYQLAGEILTGAPAETYSNGHMERGKEMEPAARAQYVFEADAEVVQVGFIRNGLAGCSPDGLVGEDGGVEIKSRLPGLMVDLILSGKLPSEHKAQVQGSLWVTGREWWDFVAFWPRLPLFTLRVYRDEPYIATLAKEVALFREELDEVVAKVRSYGGGEA